jgi:ankyrin repeat protein
MHFPASFFSVTAIASVLALATPAWAAADARLPDAAANRDRASVQTLLRGGANANARQPDGATALHWAAHWDDLEIADALIRAGADVNAANDFGATPLALACTNASAALVERLLAAGANPNAAASSGETPLMRCARTGNAQAVKSLLARRADVNAKDKEQAQTALMWAVAQKHAAAAQALIEGGADVHAKSRGGFTPLLFAARVGDAESAAVLVAAGARVNEVGPAGMTPLLMAAASGQEAAGIFLLEKGADPNARDENGATALHYSVLTGMTALNQIRIANYVAHLFRPSLTKLVEALLAKGADPNARLTKTPTLAGDSEAAGIGATPLLLAAATPDPLVMRLLKARGADPAIPTMTKLTPVMVAAGVGRGQDFTEDEKRRALEAVQLAVEWGNDVTAQNADGLTALHGASANGADVVVEFLAAKGAGLDVRDKYQQTPLSIATGIRLPWIPYGEELGEIIQPSTRDLLLKLGATPVDTPDYFKAQGTDSEVYRINQSQRIGGVPVRQLPGAQAQPPQQ